MLPPSVQHFSERKREKPSVILRIDNERGSESLEIEALLDPASYKTNSNSSEDMILRYIARKLANIIKANHDYADQLRHVHLQDVS